ncbi:MAG: 1,4-dihydroxy-6-naphthoate synthase [Desulfobulbaceae bacterium]|nr:1,4-dihydroxy-6-naphthoate synthase [Desulfobulbaceae bacterium]
MAAEFLTLGFSPCPNDTFIFHGLVHGLAAASGLNLAEPQLADVETLNEWALAGLLDVSKISCHALGFVLDEYHLLAAGAALGRGCGPLLVAREPISSTELARSRIAIPGRLTTAALLLKFFAPHCTDLMPMRFDLIMPAIIAGQVDAGVIIHESRFTYLQHGLRCLRDLGGWWEEVSGSPIPLGCIVARRSLGEKRLALLEELIRDSVRQAFKSPELSRDYIRRHAQELDAQVIAEHIGLYVNSYSLDLGEEGRNTIAQLLKRGHGEGIFPGVTEGGLHSRAG